MKTIGYLLLALLLLGALALFFWLHPLMGLFMTLLMGGVFWWIYGVRKPKVDHVLEEVARQSGLTVERSRIAYHKLRGKFRGYDTEVGVYKSHEAGVGAQLTVLTGEAGWSALDIRNFTAIKMKHGLPLQREIALSSGIVATPREVVLEFPYVSQDANEILRGMKRLVREIKQLERSLETYGQSR